MIGIAVVLVAVLLVLLLMPTFSILGTWTNDSQSYTFNIDGSVVSKGTGVFGTSVRNGRYSFSTDGTLTIFGDDSSDYSTYRNPTVKSDILYLEGIPYQKS